MLRKVLYGMALLLAGTVLVLAEEERIGSVTVLPEVVITPTREADEAAGLPYAVSLLGRDEIVFDQQVRSMPEALREESSVMVQKTAQGQGSPYIRGFTGFRNVMLIDGIRLNNSVFREGPNQYWNTVDPLSIDRLELMKGPASLLYGSDAIGGVVQALTLRPSMDDKASGCLLYRHATADDSNIARAEGSGSLGGKWGGIGGFSWKEFNDLEAGDGTGEQPKTGYGERAWDAKMEYITKNQGWLTLAHQGVEQDDVWRTHRTIFAKSFEGTKPGTDKVFTLDQHRYLTYARFDQDDMGGWMDSLQGALSWHRQEEDQLRVRKDDTSDQQGFEVDTLGAQLHMASQTPVGNLAYGTEFYRDYVKSFLRKYAADGSFVSESYQGPVADDATYDLAGLYVQDTVEVGRRMELLLGGRFNYSAVDADRVQNAATGEKFSMEDDWTAVVGSGRLLCRLADENLCNLYAGVSQGFRAPNLSDLTRFDIARTDEVETPAPDLDPEYFTTWEAGVKSSGRRGALELAYYYTAIDDLIVRTPTGLVLEDGREVTKKNAGEGWVHGVEGSGRLVVAEDWTFHVAASWQEGEVDQFPTSDATSQREPLDRLMPAMVITGIRWDHPGKRCWLEGLVTWADEKNDLSSAEKLDTQRIPPGGTPGYTVYTARGGWEATRDLSLALALENIVDEDYRVHGSGVNEAGRNVIATASVKF